MTPTMKVSELLDSPEKWCQGHMALDDYGSSIDPCSESACRWCLGGAIKRCYVGPYDVIQIASHAINIGWISQWNDAPHRTFAEVRKLVEDLDI